MVTAHQRLKKEPAQWSGSPFLCQQTRRTAYLRVNAPTAAPDAVFEKSGI